MSAEVVNLLKRLIKQAERWAEKSEGDMLKSTYDPDDDGKVVITEDSDKLEGSSKAQVRAYILSPDYDSDFVSIANGVTTDFVHNLDTKNLLCQILVRTPASAYQTLWGSNNCISDAWIHDNNTIKISNTWGVTKEFRLLLWKF